MNVSLAGAYDETLRAAELRLYDALVAGEHDRTAALLDRELIYIHSNGAVEGFDVYLKALQPWRTVAFATSLLAILVLMGAVVGALLTA